MAGEAEHSGKQLDLPVIYVPLQHHKCHFTQKDQMINNKKHCKGNRKQWQVHFAEHGT